MKHEKVLSLLILNESALVMLGVVSDFALSPLLPSWLRAHVAADGIATFRLSDTLLTVLWVIVAVSTVLAWIGLLNLLRVARPLYLASWAAYLALILFSGPVVSTAASSMVQMMIALTGGAIVGVIYFSELRAKFRPLSEAFSGAAENAA
ncbi:MAG: hypothetical protein AB1631_12505 [Acidobacteriota bacterium]